MSEATTEGRFCIDLPNPDAAIALSGTGQSTLHKLETLTGASFALRGLQLEIKGNSYQLERAAAIVELVRPIWQEGQIVSPVFVINKLVDRCLSPLSSYNITSPAEASVSVSSSLSTFLNNS